MASSSFGNKLNPYRRLRDPLGVKATRQTVVVTNNPATVDQNQQLLVRFPNLGADDVIVPGTARLAFTISLSSTDANRTLVQNIGRAICKRVTIRFSGNEVMSIDDSDVYYCYQDLWKTARERENAQYQAIDTTADRNATKIRVGTGDAANVPADKAISEAYGNRFFVSLDFEILESHMPFYQAGLGDRLEYELTFNEYGSTVQTTAAAGGSYTVENISLEFALADVSLPEYLTSKYALWLDLRSTDDNQLHGTGRRIENASEGVTLQITKKPEAAGVLDVYVFLIMDAQLNLEDGQITSILY